MESKDIRSAEGNRDSLLVRKVKAGDVEAFGELVSRYRTRIYHTAYQMTNSYADADDLAQEALIRAYHSLATFDERANFYTWLYRIVVNLSIDHLRKQRHRQHVSLDEKIIMDAQQSKLLTETGDNPRKALENKELHQELT